MKHIANIAILSVAWATIDCATTTPASSQTTPATSDGSPSEPRPARPPHPDTVSAEKDPRAATDNDEEGAREEETEAAEAEGVNEPVQDPCAAFNQQKRMSAEEHMKTFGCPPCPCACVNGVIRCAPCARCVPSRYPDAPNRVAPPEPLTDP